MTCIVGLIEKGNIYMGADSAGVNGYSLHIRADEKVFVKNNLIIGFTGSFRMGQLIRFNLSIPKCIDEIDPFEWMVTKFIESTRKCLKKGGYLKIHDNSETGGLFMVGFRGRLYRIDSDFQVGECYERYMAIGCGEELARGALYAMDNNHFKPEEKIKIALSAAEKFSTGVAKPFIIKSIEWDDKLGEPLPRFRGVGEEDTTIL